MEDMGIMNKTVLVTGSSRGIGRATAIYFGEHGYNVVVCYHEHEREANEVVDIINKSSTAIAVRVDVGDRESVQHMHDVAVKHFGKVDVIVNNAGIARTTLIQDITHDDLDALVDTNMKGMHYVTRAFLDEMVSRKSGAIVNISSIWGVKGGSMEVAYSMTKAGVIGYTKALAREVGMSGIRVNAVAPGVICTDMIANVTEDTLEWLRDEVALGRLGQPIDVAKAGYFLANDDAGYITGQVLVVDGGMI